MKTNLCQHVVGLLLVCAALFSQSPKPAARPESFDWDHEIAVADDFYDNGQYAEAERHYRASLKIAQQLKMGETEVATSLASVAWSLRKQKKYAEAEPLFRQSLAIRERVLPPNHPRTAATAEGLAGTLVGEGHDGEAEPFYLRALAMWDHMRPEDHEDCEHGNVLDLLGRLYFRAHEYQKAEAMYLRAISVWQEAKEKCTVIVPVMNELATIYQNQGRLDKSEAMYRQTIPMLQKELEGEQPELVAAQVAGLARVYMLEQKFPEAAENYQSAIPVLQKAQDRELLKSALSGYAFVLKNQGRDVEQLRVQSQLDAMTKTDIGDSANSTVQWRALLDAAAKAQGEHDAAKQEEALQQALKVAPRVAPNLGAVPQTYYRLAVFYNAQQKTDQAETAINSSVDAANHLFGARSRELRTSLFQQGQMLSMHRKYGRSAPILERVVTLSSWPAPADLQLTLTAFDFLGTDYFETGKYEQAISAYERKLRLVESSDPKNFMGVAVTCDVLGAVYAVTKKYDAAEKYYRRELQIREQEQGPENPALVGPLGELAKILWKENRADEAQPFDARQKRILARLNASKN